MKLHLNASLKCALLACMALAAQAGAAITINEEQMTQSLSENFNAGGVSYNAETGFLTGLTNTGAITFELNYTALADATTIATGTGLLYVKSAANNHWGFNVYGDSTNGNKIVGHWSGNNPTDWTTNYAVSKNTLADLDEDHDGAITLTASIVSGGTGTRLFAGTSATGTALYDKSNLTASSNTITSVYANKDYINSITYTGENLSKSTAHVVAGNTTKDYASWANTSISNEGVDATMIIAGRVQADGGNTGSAATLNTNGGDIWVGKAGQLFLQTWNVGAITLANDIYLGTSTYAGTGHSDGYAETGALRFGNNHTGGATTTLNGNIVLVENSAMSSSDTANAVNINGTVSGAYELTFRTGKGVSFNGGININKLTVEGGEIAISGVLNLSGDLALKGGVTNLGAGEHTVKVLDGSVAGNGAGTLNVGAGAQLTVSSSIWSRSNSNINIEDGGRIVLGALTIDGQEGGSSLATTGSNTQYGMGNNTYTINNAAVTITANNQTFSNKLVGSSLANEGTGTVTLKQQEGNSVTDLLAVNGNIKWVNVGAEQVSVDMLYFEGTNTIGVYQNETATEANEASVSTGILFVNSENTVNLNANLELADGAILLTFGTVNMGSDLTLGSDLKLWNKLVGSTYSFEMPEEGPLTLFTGVDNLFVGGEQIADGASVLASTVFGNIENDLTDPEAMVLYNLHFNDGAVTLSMDVVPEPATATLSLLALAGLAARRRRH